LFADRDAPSRIRDELARECESLGFASVDDAFCVALESVARMVN
jgi:uncharacterized metal-binding protein